MIDLLTHPGGAAALYATELDSDDIGFAWLGQAGFLFRYRDLRILIDPYLSDHLAQKYQGTYYPHIRMMNAPLIASQLTNLDWVLCTHRHSDHMDPGSLGIIAAGNPKCQFIIPAAEKEAAEKAGIPRERMVLTNADQHHLLNQEGPARVQVLPAAHEQIQTNPQGEHHFLGFVLQLGPVTFYHSGDCIPFPDQLRLLQPWKVDIALLPVNGRDHQRRSHGVPGNMNFAEAANLCRQAEIPMLIPHHFGMFEFNTITWTELVHASNKLVQPSCHIPEVNQWYSIRTSTN